MIRTLLTTTALAALLTSGAIAQNATDSQLLNEGYSIVDTDGLASKLIGFPVYSSANDDAEQLGEINDLVIGQDGAVQAVILGVGGFLGIGEKNVAVEYSNLQWTTAADNTERLVFATTKEALNAAPAVELQDDQPMDTAATATDPNAPADTSAMATATDTAATTTDPSAAATDANAPATDTAAAPADPNAPAADPNAAATDTAAAPADPNAPAADPNAQPADVAAVPAEPVDNTETGAVNTNDAAANNAAAPFDPAGYQDFDETALTAEELIGTQVYGVNNEHIGPIGDVLLSEDGKSIDAIIIDFGGFLGIGVKEVAVGFENLDFRADGNNNRVLVLNLTREQMDQATAFNRDTYANERDQQRYVVSAM